MNTKLQQSKLIPLYQPFDATPWSYNGNESFTLGYVPYDVVDWVLVEIYDKTNLKLKLAPGGGTAVSLMPATVEEAKHFKKYK